MKTAEQKAVVLNKRFFFHKNGGIISGDEITRAIYLMTGDVRLDETDPRMDGFVVTFFRNIEREMKPEEITVQNFLKHHEKMKAVKLYYDMRNATPHKCTLVEARDYVYNMENEMKAGGQL